MLQLSEGLFGMDIFGGYQPDSSYMGVDKHKTKKNRHPDLKRKRKNKQAKTSRRKNRRQ